MVVIFALDKDGNQKVTTYGKSVSDSRCAAAAGNALKKHLGWPDDLCHAKPADRTCGNCRFFEGKISFDDEWSDGGPIGNCMLEPKKVHRHYQNVACRFFEGKGWG